MRFRGQRLGDRKKDGVARPAENEGGKERKLVTSRD